MASSIATTDDIAGSRVIVQGRKGKERRVGKVSRFVFHPKEKRIVGFLVKRPDLALMFHRKDLFVALDGYTVEDGRIVVDDDDGACGKRAEKSLGVDFDRCVLWSGMPVVTASGETLGVVGNVSFDRFSGSLVSLEVNDGAANDAIVGRRTVPADLVKGFRFGIGAPLSDHGPDASEREEEEVVRGAILVSDEAARIETEGGAADAAGKAAAKATEAVRSAVSDLKPGVADATKAAGDAINKGAYATGRQIGRASGMFGAFKEEYRKEVGQPAPASKPRPAASSAASPSKSNAGQDASPHSSQKKSDKKATSAKPGVRKKPQNETLGHAVGKQLGRAGGMFAAFKEEYDKARKE